MSRRARPRQRHVDDRGDAAGPRAHHIDLVRHEHRLGDRMGHQQRRGAGLRPDPQQLEVHALPRDLIQCAERLVEQQNIRRQHQRPRDGDALLHAAGQLMRQGVFEALQPDKIDQFVAAARRPLGAVAPTTSSGSSMFCLTERQGSRVGLWNTKPSEWAWRAARGVSPPSVIGAGMRLHDVGDQPQQRRLSAAARPDDRRELAGRHMHVDFFERDHRFATAIKHHGDLINLDIARHAMIAAAIRPTARRRYKMDRRDLPPSCPS